MPSMAELRDIFRKLGVSNNSRIILYSIAPTPQSTTRVYLTLDAMGLAKNVSLLDGGLGLWLAEKRPVTTGVKTVKPGTVEPCEQKDVVTDIAYVSGNLKKPGVDIIDARLPNFYNGTTVSYDHFGHIPGAQNVPFDSVLDSSGKFKSADELEASPEWRRREAGRSRGELLPRGPAGDRHLFRGPLPRLRCPYVRRLVAGVGLAHRASNREVKIPQIVQAIRALFGDRLACRMIERIGAHVQRIERVQLGPRRFVIVNSPELIQEIFVEGVDQYMKGPVLRVIARPLLGDGLLTSEGEAHRHRRKLVAPSFAHQRVSRYAAVMTEQTLAAQAQWRDGQRVNMAQEMMRLTLGIVGRALFDVDLLDQADSLGADITTVQESADIRMKLMPIKLPYRKEERLALERLNATMFGMIAERRKTGEDHGDLMSMLMMSKDEETGEHLNDQQVRDESMTLFLAGHETTAQAMAWSCYLLSKNPQYFERLRNGGPAFALQVMKESMRLYPPAFLLARTPIRETSIDGFKVTPEDLVIIAPWLLHRDARFFEDPLRFDPDRFLPEREAKLPRFAYMPFGGGRRICIGNQFALMEGQIILHTVGQHIRSMDLLTDKPIPLEPYITLRPKGGVPLRLHRN